MAWDIYGERLERGHCEVHPHVHEEYPCSICLAESREKRRMQKEQEQAWSREAEAYYAQMAEDLNRGINGDGI